MTHWRSGLRNHGFHHDEQCDENVAIIDNLVVALEAMLKDYRSEGCPDQQCCVCAASRVAESNARAALASVER